MATRYLLDTNALTALAQNDPIAWGHLRELASGDSLYVSFVVVAEWETGLLLAATPQRRAVLGALGMPVFQMLTGVWHSSTAVITSYARILADLRQAGSIIPTNDVWIAATASAHNAVLVTADRHFARVSGLRTEDWTVP